MHNGRHTPHQELWLSSHLAGSPVALEWHPRHKVDGDQVAGPRNTRQIGPTPQHRFSDGTSGYSQQVYFFGASCVSVNRSLAMMRVALRRAPGFASMRMRTFALPEPVTPSVMVAHGTGLDDVHEQLGCTFT